MDPYSTTQTIDRTIYDFQGNLYIRVVGAYNLVTPFTLNVSVTAGACNAVNEISQSYSVINDTVTSGSYKTLILTDSNRLEGTPTEISTALADLQTLSARADVSGLVIDLADAKYQRVAQANIQADANPTCPHAKNILAGEIKSVINEYRTANAATLEYIVLAGGADVIPFFQVNDVAGLADEKDYIVPVAPSSPSDAGLKSNLVQGQDGYGSQVDITQGGYKLAAPDLAVGRLVDTASDISITVNAYIATNGVIAPSSSLVTGYDFVGDAASAISTEMQAGTASTVDELIQAPGLPPTAPSAWTANQLRAKLFAGNFDIAVLTGHFSAGTLLAADYATQISAEEILYNSVDLNNVLFMTLGCHGGYTIPNTDLLAGASPDPDWAKAFLRKGAAGYVAATGYAYGDTELTEYGERLFVLMAKELRTGNDPVSIGKAVMEAKRKYLASTAQLTGIDQKTIVEMTLYGLPMMKVNMPGTRLSPSTDTSLVGSNSDVSSGAGASLGLRVASALGVPSSLTGNNKDLENLSTSSTVTTTYYTGGDGFVANPFEPILPKEVHDVSVPGSVLRGVAFRGGVYTDQTGIVPLTSSPTTETSTAHQSFNSDVFYPTQLWLANYYDALNGGITRLVTFPAQFKSTEPGAIDGTLRTFSSLDFKFYYLPDDWTSISSQIRAAGVSAAPSILGVSAVEDNSDVVTFNVNVSADGSAGVQEVWVLYTGKSAGDPYYGTWTPLDLTQNVDDPDLWEGTLNLPTGANAQNVQFMVQAVGGAGLATLDTNSGAYYVPTPYAAVPPAAASPTTLTLQSPAASGVYGKDISFTARLLSGVTPVSGKVISFNVGGLQSFAVTNGAGDATVTMKLFRKPGSYTVQAGFRGDSSYLRSSDSSDLTVNKDTTTIEVTSSPISAVLKDSSGNVLGGKSIVFIVHKASVSYLRSVIADYNGVADLGLVPLPPDVNYSVDVYFNGTIPGYSLTVDDDYYESSSSVGSLLLTVNANDQSEFKPPMVTASATKADGSPYTANTWSSQNVTVHFTCTDTQSGVASCPADQTFSAAGTFTASGTTFDNAGNSAGASFGLIKIDKTAPTLAPVISPKAIYLKSAATATPNAADGESGIASQSCDPVNTNTIGAKKLTCKATDSAGNVKSVTLSYQVLYKFTGFFLPTHNAPALNKMSAGNAVKVVFGLNGNQGLSVFAAGYPKSAVVSCGSGTSYNIITTKDPTSSLKYSAASKRYTYTWKTTASWAGTCRRLDLKFKDGRIYKLMFKFVP